MAQMAGGVRIHQLQSLRFVAAAFVLYGHVLMEARQHGSSFARHWTYDLPWGGGVDIFFVISGFIILHIAQNAPRTLAAAGDSLAKRAIWLVPLYWIFTAAMAAVMLLLPARVGHGGLTAGSFLHSLLFFPYRYAPTGEVMPVLGQGWTLNCEFFFYVVIAVTIALTRRRFVWASAALLALVAIWMMTPLAVVPGFLFSPFLLLFVAGMALAHFRDRLPRHGTAVAALIAVTACAWVAIVPPDAPFDDAWRLVSRGIPAILLVYAALQWRAPPHWVTHGVLPVLGDASYALYLSHPFVVNAVLIAFGALGLPSEGLFVLMSMLAAVIASVAIFRWIEAPLLLALTRAYRRSALGERLTRGVRTEPTSLAATRGTAA